MGQIAHWVPAYSAGGLTRPALALDENGNIILFGEAADFVAVNGLKLLYLGLPTSTPFPPIAPAPGTTQTATPSDPTPPVVIPPNPPTTQTAAAASGGSGGTAPAFTLNGITRPELHFDSAGNIILDPAAAQFVAAYGVKPLYAGLPASTPFPPVAATPPSTPTDSNGAANSIAEGAAANSATGVTASSSSLTGQTITYALTADSSNGGFKINAATGVVTVADPAKINFETATNGAYQISVRASDGIFTASQTFTIGVTNVAPSTPTDSNAAANTVAEGAAVGTIVGITASSTDINGPAVTYSLTADSSNGGFTVNATTGVVTVADSTKLDYETSGAGKTYSVTVAASDGSQTASQNFSIAVTDVPLTTPTDANPSANLVAEGAAAGSTVGLTGFATDPNGPTTTYSLTADSSGGGFTIDPATGVVTVADASKIDFESAPGNAYSVTVQANNGAMTTSQSFSIGVGNVAPLTPVDSDAAANAIAEGAANGSTVGVTASSTDVNGPAVTYSLTGDTSGGGFTINATTGVVTIADATRIDFESSGGSYTVTAQASDGTLTSSQTFTIAVTDVAPSTPVDVNAAANAIAEGAANGSTVGVTASSTDINGPAVTYSLVGDSSNGGFAINSATGVVTVADTSKIDFESSGGSYSITTQASDGTLSSSQTFTIAVSNAAPATPVDGNAATNTIAEGAANGSTVGVTVSSTDVNGPATTYTLVGDTSGGGFAIDATTGVVTVADATRIDFESSGGSYTIVAQANDGTLTSWQAFTIAVTDIAPSTPVDANAATNTIAEGAANGSTVGITASSTDINGPAVSYSLTDSAGGRFTIDPGTGVVTVANGAAIDFETAPGNVYSITAQASDGTLTSSQTFTIAVTDVAPSTPVDTNAAANTIAEGAANGSTVGITASSTDINGPAVTYSLIGDTSGGGFTIDATTGVVTVADATRINFESSGGSYSITTQASDGTLSSSQTFTIAVSNAAPTTPVDDDAATNTIAEGSTNGSTVGVTVSSTDVNGPATTYTLVGDTSLGGFAIDATTGVVTIADATRIDFESSGGSYTIVAQASDGTLTSSQAFTVAVTNSPPSAPTDTNANANKTFAGAAVGSATGVTASSSDPAGGTVTYALLDDNGAVANGGDRFQINASTGIITVSGVTAITYDSVTPANNDYVITVRASDPSGAFTSQTFTVTVDPNQPPVIGSDGGGNNAAISVAENGTAVTTVNATDGDNGPSPISYSIVGGDDANKFGIVASGAGAGTLTFIAPPDFENPTDTATNGSNTYTVVVRASDGAAFDDQTITVTITDTNDAPVITSNGGGGTTSININENQTAVTTVTAADQDSPAQTLTYSIVNGGGSPDSAKFAIDASGNLTFIGAPNFEIPGSAANSNAYTVQVQVSDNGAGNLTDIQTITVNVQNVNEAPTTNAVTASGAEDAASIAITLSGTDPDAGDSIASYTITNLPSPSQGVLYSDAGLTNAVVSGQTYGATLYLDPAPNFNGAVTFSATANDTSGLAGNTATETINITPVNDAPTVTVPLNSSVGTAFSNTDLAIAGVSTGDIDAGSGNVTTTITAVSGSLTFNLAGLASSTNNGTGTVTLTGTVAQVNSALSSLTYHSNDGFTGADTISVSTSDLGNTGSGGTLGSGTSSFQVGVVPQVFIIDNTGGGSGGNGTSATPFKTIANFNATALDGTDDYIYIRQGTGTYSEADGINLIGNQHLYGQGQTLQFTNPVTGEVVTIGIGSSGATPIISVTGANNHGIDLSIGNEVRGLNVATTASTQTGIFDNGGVGALTIADVDVSGSGQAVKITNGGTLNVAIDTLSSSGGAYGIQLGGAITGSFTGTTGALSGHGASEVQISGGTGTISYGGTIGNGSGDSAQINNRTGGSVTLSGNINDTNDAGGGIVVSGNSGGTITFSGATKTLTTGSSIGVSLTNNAGTTINFTNGGLDIDTTTVEGFGAAGAGPSAASGGTVNITGSGNHITSTNGGSALLFYNTTIGASGLTFQDLSSNGAVNGIVLNNTGASGGLTVTGDAGSTKNGSGGTIQNTSGDGISLTNTQNVVFDQLNISGTGGSGVNGTGVTNFSHTNSTFTNTGDATVPGGQSAHDSAINFNGNNTGVGKNISGTLTVSGNTITNAYYAGLNVESDDGTVTHADIVNNIITNPGFSGVNFSTTGTATTAFSLNDADIANNNISSSGGNGIQISIGNGNSGASGAAAAAHAGKVTIDGFGRPISDPNNIISIFNNLITLDSGGTQAITVANTTASSNASARSQTNFEILNNGTLANPLGSSAIGTVILIGNNGNSDMAGFIDNNRITASHSPDVGNGNGIAGGNGVGGAGNAWTPRLNLTVSNNNIANTDGSGILLVGRGTSGEAYLKIANNVVTTPLAQAGSGAESGINVDAGNGSSADDEVYLNIFGNTSGGHDGALGIGIRKQGTTATINDFGIYDAAGGPVLPASPTNTDVVNFINALNPSGGGTYVVNGSNFLRDATLAPPQLVAAGGVQAASPTPGEMHLTQTQLDNTVAAAIALWAAAGATETQLAALRATNFSVGGLSDNKVGEQTPGHVIIDNDAAGHGWFVDPTPTDHSEFAHSANAEGTNLFTDPTTAAAGHIDLVTVVAHEMGHILGLPDIVSPAGGDDLLSQEIVAGQRRLPDATDVVNAIESQLPVSAQAAAGTPIVIGTAQNDIILAGQVDQTHGGKILFGGAGADTFVFDTSVQTGPSTQITHVADYSAAQGDRFDFTGLTAEIQQRDVGDLMQVRAVADPSGHFATLQINSNAAPDGNTAWVSIAQLDGLRGGDFVDVVVGPAVAPHLLHLHVDLIA